MEQEDQGEEMKKEDYLSALKGVLDSTSIKELEAVKSKFNLSDTSDIDKATVRRFYGSKCCSLSAIVSTDRDIETEIKNPCELANSRVRFFGGVDASKTSSGSSIAYLL